LARWLDFSQQSVAETRLQTVQTTFISRLSALRMSSPPSALSAQKLWLSDAVAELLASAAAAEAAAEAAQVRGEASHGQALCAGLPSTGARRKPEERRTLGRLGLGLGLGSSTP
jgi:hypothetical protein